MTAFSTAHTGGKATLATIADWLAIAVAISLPWSTSATAILVVLWAIACIPTVGWAGIRREALTAAGGLPVALVLLGMAGMAWSDVTFVERWKGFDSFLKLLAIPLLLAQFRRSGRGEWVFAGYLCSCIALLLATTFVMAVPALSKSLLHDDNVLVKNAATQSGEFVTCIFGLLYFLIDAVDRRRWELVIGCSVIALAMLANILYVSTGRTALIVIVALLVVLAIRRPKPKVIAAICAGAILVGVVGWNTSPYLYGRATEIRTDLKKYEAADTLTSSGERLVFWKKSIEFISRAPLIGHGTGSIRSLFEKASVNQTGAAAEVTANPHHQTLAIAVQLGVAGAALLWAMWIAHLLLFRGHGLAEWIGLVIVVQNIVGSLFNSHLFDFVQGWVYVIGVGVAGGIALKNREQGDAYVPDQIAKPAAA